MNPWNLILRTLKKPDVTAIHTSPLSRTFLVTVTPPADAELEPFDAFDIETMVQHECNEWQDGYTVEVQAIG